MDFFEKILMLIIFRRFLRLENPSIQISFELKHDAHMRSSLVHNRTRDVTSCKLESKTRAKVFGKVDTLETYQLPQA